MHGPGIPLLVVDAFTSAPFAGNPAGVCLPGEGADAAWMQAVASELGVSETAFAVPSGEAGRFGLRWFTPVCEVELCGHATLAAAHVLWEEGILRDRAEARFETLSGPLGARRSPEGLISLDFPAEPAEPRTPPDGLLEALGIRAPVAVARNRLDWLVELDSADSVRALSPDVSTLRELVPRGVVVTAPGTGEADVVSRFFAPAVGVDEDPVTGSAHCAIGPWFAERLGSRLHCVQASPRGGTVLVEVQGDRISLSGAATTVIRGHLAPRVPPPQAAGT